MKFITILFNHAVKILSGRKFTKNILITKIFYYCKALLKEKSLIIDGNIIYLDKFDSLSLSINNIYEPQETNIVKQHIKKTDVIIDIGANIGYYTILFSRLGKEVHAFEPDPTNFKLLEKNIKVNHITNVITNQKGISNKSETVNLFLNKLNTGGHYITNQTKDTIPINVIKLDDYIQYADFIKMDIEGAEFMALQGMSKLLSNPNLKLLIEYNSMAIKNFGGDPIVFLCFLSNYFIVLNVKNNKIIDNFESFVKNTVITNLFCYKKPTDVTVEGKK